MPSTNDAIPSQAHEFHTTRWSVVLAAKGESPSATDALSHLCQAYWYPLYAYIRRQGLSPADAQDLTQDFFARLLEKHWLDPVLPELGRFRAWLLATAKHFLSNHWDRARARKRGGGTQFVSIDDATAEARYANEPAEVKTAEHLFDRRWALTLLDRVLTRLREEFAQGGKIEQFDALKDTLTGGGEGYAGIAARLGTTEGAVKVAVHRLRERYRALIRTEIAETVATPADVESELKHLLAALSG